MTSVTTSVTPSIFIYRRVSGLLCAHRVSDMEQEKPHIVLCIWCQRRITVEELRSGRHDHVDVQERIEYDLAVNNGND